MQKRIYHNGKQKFICLPYHRKFVENQQNKVVLEDAPEGIRRAFTVLKDLNADITLENKKFLVAFATIASHQIPARNR